MTTTTPRLLPADPDDLNDERADWAARALDTFIAATRTDPEDALCDLLCDLMHWADRNAGAFASDFASDLRRAETHYAAETEADDDDTAEETTTDGDFSFRVLTPEQDQEFRTWAREHYTPGQDCSPSWHPIIREEWARIAAETTESPVSDATDTAPLDGPECPNCGSTETEYAGNTGGADGAYDYCCTTCDLCFDIIDDDPTDE